MNEVGESYANTMKHNLKTNAEPPNFRRILQESKNEELAQRKERDARASNIIIFNLPENNETAESKKDDLEIVKELLVAIEVTSLPESVIRLGKPNETKARPIKIIMSNQDDKELIMCSVTKLKDGPEKFKRISITEDYTPEERLAIREKVKEAKRKTELEGEGKYVFKVRGTPKNGLMIRRFTVASPVNTV